MNEPDNASDFDASHWPSVDLAYEFVAPSYDWAQRRFESIERRIHTFLAFTATLTIGVPVLVATAVDHANFTSVWFIAVVACAIATLALGMAAKILSSVSEFHFLVPDSLHEDWLDYPEWEFKTNAIYWAGEHFKKNIALIHKMGLMLGGMHILFSVEVILLLIWIVAAIA